MHVFLLSLVLAFSSVGGHYDSNWGPVYLEVRGDRVTGTYECCGGGTIEGVIVGDEIQYEWVQPGASGRGIWKIVDNGHVLEGPWGHGTSETNGGPWILYRHDDVS